MSVPWISKIYQGESTFNLNWWHFESHPSVDFLELIRNTRSGAFKIRLLNALSFVTDRKKTEKYYAELLSFTVTLVISLFNSWWRHSSFMLFSKKSVSGVGSMCHILFFCQEIFKESVLETRIIFYIIKAIVTLVIMSTLYSITIYLWFCNVNKMIIMEKVKIVL